MEEAKWIDWAETQRLLTLAGVGWYQEPRAWAASGLVSTKADVVTFGDEVRRDQPIDKEIWQAAQRRRGVMFSPMVPGGKLYAKTPEGDAFFMGISFNETELFRLLPRIPSEDERHAAKVADIHGDGSVANELRPEAEEEAPTPAPSRAGRKADGERWADFYFCVVELAKDGRLTPEHFPSQGSLNEELALMMGDNAFNIDHVKGRVAQIYKRFVEG